MKHGAWLGDTRLEMKNVKTPKVAMPVFGKCHASAAVIGLFWALQPLHYGARTVCTSHFLRLTRAHLCHRIATGVS
jgi:hypothetical protein